MTKKIKKREKVHEIYEIEKGGKEQIIETNGIIKEDSPTKEKVAKENNVLKWILISIGIILLIIVLIFVIKNTQNKFQYKGMKFEVIKEGELTFYQTSFQVVFNKTPARYNIYLRNDPRNIQREVPLNGELNLRNFLVLNTTTEDLFCEGDWNLAIGNMQNLRIFNIKVMKDENASCDQNGNYMFVQIEEGNETRIEQYGPSCYKLIVNNCEILPVTERFMVETFVKFNEGLTN
jgi:hypothetical protein